MHNEVRNNLLTDLLKKVIIPGRDTDRIFNGTNRNSIQSLLKIQSTGKSKKDWITLSISYYTRGAGLIEAEHLSDPWIHV